MRDKDRHLKLRGQRWYYVRRVPTHITHLDRRKKVESSLKTTNVDVARHRRDGMEEADDLYWVTLLSSGDATGPTAEKRYEAAKARAMVLGFTYRTVEDLVNDAPLEELLRRVEVLEVSGPPSRQGASSKVPSLRDVEAVLGGVQRPVVRITKALDEYFKHTAPTELKGKSPKQRASWEKVKRRAIANFVKVVGNKPVEKITREDALKFYDWWSKRVAGTLRSKNGKRGLSGNSANRDIGNVRLLLREHFKRLGEEDRLNPFRNLNFADKKSDKVDVQPFPTDWIANTILRSQSFKRLNRDAALIVLTMIETGCRPSEICNLPPDCIRLEDDVPHLRIKFREGRAIKSESSVRDIPLVGVSLEAMRAAPTGFERYMDKEDILSATLMKHFRRAGLFPEGNYRIYSFRHAFEKRMLEAGIDYGLRCLLMGHANDRPEYGDGGSLTFRREQLQRIVFDVPDGLVAGIQNAPQARFGRRRTSVPKRRLKPRM